MTTRFVVQYIKGWNTKKYKAWQSNCLGPSKSYRAKRPEMKRNTFIFRRVQVQYNKLASGRLTSKLVVLHC